MWKLTDFGLASEATSSQFNNTTSARGSVGYRSPELASINQFSNKVDIWSMGCLLHELATGKRAFNNDYEVLEYSSKNDPLCVCLDNRLDEAAKHTISDSISRMLQKEPSARPSAAELYKEFCGHCHVQFYFPGNGGSDDLRTASLKMEGKTMP
jgi:serine/threonine protein kinase